MKEIRFWFRTGYPTHTSVTNFIGAVPVYYDLKENTNWEPDFEALEKLDLTKAKKSCGLAIRICQQELEEYCLFEKLVAFAKKTKDID
jgi:hypothetical protein